MINNMSRILIVDDDRDLRKILKDTLTRRGYDVILAGSGQEALQMLEEAPVDLVISDLMMPGIKGIDLLVEIHQLYPEIGFLMMTAYGTVETAVEAMQKGAFDFLTKPFSISQIESRVERFYEYRSLREENSKLKKELKTQNLNKTIVGQSRAIQDLFYHIEIVAKSDAPVFLIGESGTGKELIAQAIHDQSSRADKPFLKINCAAVPETLFESTLFGHERGSYTGALKMQKGLFEEAHQGTLLLDEISEIPHNLQAKLLRVLQENRVTRVGNTQETEVDVRVIATTNRDIRQLVSAAKFREDLYFRLNVFPIEVPALRDRKEDIPILIDHFLRTYCQKYKLELKSMHPDSLDLMVNQNWDGNVREVENTVERAILYSGRSDTIQPEHIRLERPVLSKITAGSPSKEILNIADMERQLIYKALQATNNHRTKAAELLGITVRTLRNKLNTFGDGNEDESE